jgi:Subtilase family
MPLPLVFSLGVLLLMSPWGAWAQTLNPNVIRQIAAISAEKESRTPEQAKIDSQLLYASRMHRGIPLGAGVPTMPSSIEVDSSGRTTVDISAIVSDVLLGRIRSLGGTIVNSFPQYQSIRAIFPIDRVEDLAAMPEVRFIRPADMGMVNKVVSQGDITHRADLARAKFDLNGAGITVGVLSDSVGQLSTLQAAGDLPPNCPAGPPCVSVLKGQEGTGLSEGTAMMEIVNSLAPGSNLMFATANGGLAAFASNILALQAAGAQVIVDDFTYYSEPTFQDGIVAQAVNTVVSKGVEFFSSAANDGNKASGTSGTWEGNYSGTTLPPPLAAAGITALNFGSGNNENTITVNPSTNTLVLKWSDPEGKSSNDYDLYLLDPTGTKVVLSSTNRQNGTQDPLEAISYTGSATNYRLVVVLFKGQARFMSLKAIRGQLGFNTTGATYGHNAAAEAVSVAAVGVATAGCPDCVPFVGGTKNPIETFSSDGPRRIFYNPDGTPITPGDFLAPGGQLLSKPDLTAADGVSTATAGFNPFFGTSAAAPHAAAIAALMLSRDPKLTPATLKTFQSSASLPVTQPPPGHIAGTGILDALNAVSKVPAVPTPTSTHKPTPVPTPTPTRSPAPTPTPTATPIPVLPVISSIPAAIEVGGSFPIVGSHFTNGSVVNMFVATATGPINQGPFTPASPHSSTLLTVTIPDSVTLGQGFASVQVVNTDEGFKVSNPAYALLQGSAAAGIPTIDKINGVALAATSSNPDYATNNVQTVVVPGDTLMLGGSGFSLAGVEVDVFCACPPHDLLKYDVTPSSSTLVSFPLPGSGAMAPPTGPASFQVVNLNNFRGSNAVSAPVGATISVTSVMQSGSKITVNGTGFSTLTAINFFNTQNGVVKNLGGYVDGKPAITLTLISHDQFTFEVPPGAQPGASYVQAINPPFTPYSDSGSDPGGAFTLM